MDWPAPQHLATARNTLMAYREYGRRESDPWLVLHGGPGSGCSKNSWQPFDPERHWVLAPDQRGAGQSLPRGRTLGNNTSQLIADLETLRNHLGIERWSIVAGSWGTVLALCYAQKHPERLNRVVLRGAFGLRWTEVGGLLQPHVMQRYPAPPSATWARLTRGNRFCALVRLEQMFQVGTPDVASCHALRHWSLLEQGAALRGKWRSLLHASRQPDRALWVDIRADWAAAQKQWRQSTAQRSRPRPDHTDHRALQKFRIQAHYLAHRGFVRPGQLDQGVYQLAQHNISVDWVHGHFDAVCPPANSCQWLAMMHKLQPGLAHGHWPIAGHLGNEPGVLRSLRQIIQCQKNV